MSGFAFAGGEADLDSEDFWNAPEVVERFAARDPDHRLISLMGEYPDPPQIRVLDIGCAAGRNAVALAKRGFDVHAVDTAPAMVSRTRERLAALVGESEAARRVRVGRMEDLSEFEDDFFHLVVALGVLHQAPSRVSWERTVGEIRRVLAPGGRVLVSGFSPRTHPEGATPEPAGDEPNVFAGLHAGHHYLLGPVEQDAALARFGFAPLVPTEEVTVETEKGARVTVNGLYRLRE